MSSTFHLHDLLNMGISPIPEIPQRYEENISNYFSFKTPRQLRYEGKFSLSDFDLYAISMDLTKPNDRPKNGPFWSIWYQDNRKFFGMLLPKSGENVAEVRLKQAICVHLITVVLDRNVYVVNNVSLSGWR